MRRLTFLLLCLSLSCSGSKPRDEDEPPLAESEAVKVFGLGSTREQRWRLWVEMERDEMRSEVDPLLSGDVIVKDPLAVLEHCRRYRVRARSLVRVSGKHLSEPVDGLDELFRRIGRLERLARLKAGIPD